MFKILVILHLYAISRRNAVTHQKTPQQKQVQSLYYFYDENSCEVSTKQILSKLVEIFHRSRISCVTLHFSSDHFKAHNIFVAIIIIRSGHDMRSWFKAYSRINFPLTHS